MNNVVEFKDGTPLSLEAYKFCNLQDLGISINALFQQDIEYSDDEIAEILTIRYMFIKFAEKAIKRRE